MVGVRFTSTKRGDSSLLFGWMAVCLCFLALGNLAFHERWLPVSPDGVQRLSSHFSFGYQSFEGFSTFLWAVIKSALWDIASVLLIAFSRILTVRRGFLGAVFACKSLILGYCGALIIGSIGTFDSFWQGFLSWLFFFMYHVLVLSALFCFGIATVSFQPSKSSRALYFMTVVGEIALVVFLKTIYYLLISII